MPRFKEDVEYKLINDTSDRLAVIRRNDVVRIAEPVPDAWFRDDTFMSEVRDILKNKNHSLDADSFASFQKYMRTYLVENSGRTLKRDDLLAKMVEKLYAIMHGRLSQSD